MPLLLLLSRNHHIKPLMFIPCILGTVAAAAASLLLAVKENVPCFGGTDVPKALTSTLLDLLVRAEGGGAIKRRLQQQLQVGLHHIDNHVTFHVDHPSAIHCLTPGPGTLPSLPPTFILTISPRDSGGEWARACLNSSAPPPLTACFMCASTLQHHALCAPPHEQFLAPLAAFPPDGMFNGPCISDPVIRLFLANSPVAASFRHWQPPAVYIAAGELLKPILGMDASL